MKHFLFALLPFFIATSFLAAHGETINSPYQSLEGLAIAADANRDGRVDFSDWYLKEREWSWQKTGAFMLANVDDDDKDGNIDSLDKEINGSGDKDDLSLINVWLGEDVYPQSHHLELTLSAGAEFVNLFAADGRFLKQGNVIANPSPRSQFYIEAKAFASAKWNGFAEVTAKLLSKDGTTLAQEKIVLRVAPWIMLPNSAKTKELHVATGRYQNSSFIAGLRKACKLTKTKLLPPYRTNAWKEMWMQDTMEIGYSQLPGRAPMPVVLRANRQSDSYARTLLDSDFGYIEVGKYRQLSGGDKWADWFGNLEVSHPVPNWPLGRIYYGRNTLTNEQLNPEIVAFLKAQKLQDPFWVDTSWLVIKHVDEIFNFIPVNDGKTKLCVACPKAASSLKPGEYGPYNKTIQNKLDKMLLGGIYIIKGQKVDYPGVLNFLGLDKKCVIGLPVLYSKGHPDWSSPVNSVYLNGTIVAGNAYTTPEIRRAIEECFSPLEMNVFWVDDKVYQDFSGNVHCATNTTKFPLVKTFNTSIPHSIR